MLEEKPQKFRLKKVWIAKCPMCDNELVGIDGQAFYTSKKAIVKDIKEGIICCDCDE